MDKPFDYIPEVSKALEQVIKEIVSKQFQFSILVGHRARVLPDPPVVLVHLVKVGYFNSSSPFPPLTYIISAWLEDPLEEQLVLERIRQGMKNNLLNLDCSDLGVSLFDIQAQELTLDQILTYWQSIGVPARPTLAFAVENGLR